jgi:hypothetical protein
MAPGGVLAGVLGPILGVGEGRGMGLMLVSIAILPVIASIAGWLYRPMRNVETDLPDAVEDVEENEDAAAASAAAAETTAGAGAPAGA